MIAIQSATETSQIIPVIYNKKYIYRVAAIASLGGLLFGFDLVIISGTIPFFSHYFHLQDIGLGWAVGCINLGSALGALCAGKLSDTWGRKKLLMVCAFLFAITGIGTGWAISFPVFILFRLGSGVAVGIAALVCPMYIAELAPAAWRGRLVAFYQLAIVIGLLLAYLADYLLLHAGENNWRWMFTVQSVPALLFLYGMFFTDESPRWLIRKNKIKQGLEVLGRIGDSAYAASQAEMIKESFKMEVKEHWKDIFQKKYRKIIWIGLAIAIFSQADGQNSLFSYAPEIFRQAGLSQDSAFLQSIALGLINFIFTFIAIATVDKTGRRNLLLTGSFLLCLDALTLSSAFGFHFPSFLILGFVLAFIAIYAATLGPVTWVALSEIFPNKIRGSAMSLATLALWIANFFTTASFPVMKTAFGLPVTFAIHAGICMIYFLFIWRMVPETRGRSLEEIEQLLVKQ
jgi:SP family arabinose:H+ symporter-like MFS transporter